MNTERWDSMGVLARVPATIVHRFLTSFHKVTFSRRFHVSSTSGIQPNGAKYTMQSPGFGINFSGLSRSNTSNAAFYARFYSLQATEQQESSSDDDCFIVEVPHNQKSSPQDCVAEDNVTDQGDVTKINDAAEKHVSGTKVAKGLTVEETTTSVETTNKVEEPTISAENSTSSVEETTASVAPTTSVVATTANVDETTTSVASIALDSENVDAAPLVVGDRETGTGSVTVNSKEDNAEVKGNADRENVIRDEKEPEICALENEPDQGSAVSSVHHLVEIPTDDKGATTKSENRPTAESEEESSSISVVEEVRIVYAGTDSDYSEIDVVGVEEGLCELPVHDFRPQGERLSPASDVVEILDSSSEEIEASSESSEVSGSGEGESSSLDSSIEMSETNGDVGRHANQRKKKRKHRKRSRSDSEAKTAADVVEVEVTEESEPKAKRAKHKTPEKSKKAGKTQKYFKKRKSKKEKRKLVTPTTEARGGEGSSRLVDLTADSPHKKSQATSTITALENTQESHQKSVASDDGEDIIEIDSDMDVARSPSVGGIFYADELEAQWRDESEKQRDMDDEYRRFQESMAALGGVSEDASQTSRKSRGESSSRSGKKGPENLSQGQARDSNAARSGIEAWPPGRRHGAPALTRRSCERDNFTSGWERGTSGGIMQHSQAGNLHAATGHQRGVDLPQAFNDWGDLQQGTSSSNYQLHRLAPSQNQTGSILGPFPGQALANATLPNTWDSLTSTVQTQHLGGHQFGANSPLILSHSPFGNVGPRGLVDNVGPRGVIDNLQLQISQALSQQWQQQQNRKYHVSSASGAPSGGRNRGGPSPGRRSQSPPIPVIDINQPYAGSHGKWKHVKLFLSQEPYPPPPGSNPKKKNNHGLSFGTTPLHLDWIRTCIALQPPQSCSCGTDKQTFAFGSERSIL